MLKHCPPAPDPAPTSDGLVGAIHILAWSFTHTITPMSDEKTVLRPQSPPNDAPLTGDSLDNPAPISIPGVHLGGLLGQGGMASVYEGLDVGFNPPRRVAVKLMDPAISAEPDFRARFQREASIVADFRHDNIVHVYASGEIDGTKYIVMEFLPGGTLAERLRRHPVPSEKAITIAASIADALAYSHSRGIVHRDFKPGNVMFTADDKPVLTDFGVAKVTSAREAGLTRYASVIGAPRYMAPEQELGEEVTDRVDVYGFGLTLYEMLTGELPPLSLRALRGVSEDSAFTTRLAKISPSVVGLIRRCLQFDPAGRPSAAECRDTLAPVTVARHKLTGWQDPKLSLASMRRRTLMLVGGVAVALAIGGGVTAYRQFAPAPIPGLSETKREASSDRPVSAVVIASLQFDRRPTSASVYVDGEDVQGAEARLAPGRHEVVAIAAGYHGERRVLDLAAGTAQRLPLALASIELPSLAEYDEFLRLADARELNEAELNALQERTLRTALQVRLFDLQGNTKAHNELESELRALTRLGDARAPVALLLAQGIREGRISRAMLTPPLLSASDGGDPMASLAVALAYRDALNASASSNAETDDGYRSYCARMSLVARQGWPDIAERYLKRDHCIQ
jgi:hypothetical protein